MRSLSIFAALTMGVAVSLPATASINPVSEPGASRRITAPADGIVANAGGRPALVMRFAGQYAELRYRHDAELEYRHGRFAFGRHYPRSDSPGARQPPKAKLQYRHGRFAFGRHYPLTSGSQSPAPVQPSRTELQYRHGRFAFGRHYPLASGNRIPGPTQVPKQANSSPAPTPLAAAVDPHGPLSVKPAPNAAPPEAAYSLGKALPPRLPRVILDWRQFDLPEPPPGRFYVRVGNDVLLIAAAGRIVESILPPG